MADKKIKELFRLNKVDGEIGIEIEMEGDGLLVSTKSWAEHADGSLRGNSIEYVLHSPCARDKVGDKLQELEYAWAKYGSRLNPSNRCGVHVHLNCQDKTLKQVAIILGIYYCFEDVLLEYCGEERNGNFFCLGAKHAELQLTELYNMMHNEKLTVYQIDQHYRYAAMNITSLAKFGSLEFRPLKTTKSMADVLDWVNIILCINDKAKAFKDVREVVESCSAAGPYRFLHETFGRYAEQLMCKKYDKMIMEGVRRVQEFAYAPLVLKNKKKVKDEEVGTWWDMNNAHVAINQPEGEAPHRVNWARFAAVGIGDVAAPPVKPPCPQED